MVTLNLRESIAKIIANPWRFVRIRSLAIFLGLDIPVTLKDIIRKCNEPGEILRHRTAILEIDMMQGTAFPPDEQLFENKIHTLQDIYLRAGILLDIRLDENNIPDLSGPDGVYTDAELDALLEAHRWPSNDHDPILDPFDLRPWHAYLVVVTQYDDPDPTRPAFGIMWPDSRRGCAVFHTSISNEPNFVNTIDLAFFRTSAHELGHEFNLHHEDGNTYSEGGTVKFTIMNQSGDIIGSGWPGAVGLTFRGNEIKHLTSHPRQYVKPGRERWKKCNSEHKSWHTGITD